MDRLMREEITEREGLEVASLARMRLSSNRTELTGLKKRLLRGGTQEEEERVRLEELNARLQVLQARSNRTGGGERKRSEPAGAVLSPMDSSDDLVASIAHLAAD